MKGRTLTLAVALAMAGVAVASVYVYVGRIETQTLQGLQTRDVLVATSFLPTGSTGVSILEQSAFEVRKVPLKFAAPGALDSPRDIAGLTLVDDVTAGEQLTASRFASPEQNLFLSDLPSQTEALSLPLDYVQGVSGHLQAGDRINVYVTAEGKKAMNKLLAKSNIPSSIRMFDAEAGLTIRLLTGVLVVEVPATAAEGAAPPPQPTITLAVSPTEAAWLIHAQQRAKMWFTLAKSEGSR